MGTHLYYPPDKGGWGVVFAYPKENPKKHVTFSETSRYMYVNNIKTGESKMRKVVVIGMLVLISTPINGCGHTPTIGTSTEMNISVKSEKQKNPQDKKDSHEDGTKMFKGFRIIY